MPLDPVVLLKDKEGKHFWAFFTQGVTVVSHERFDSEAWCRQAARLAHDRITEVLKS